MVDGELHKDIISGPQDTYPKSTASDIETQIRFEL
jgi:hypothetical protein